jgi:5-methylcytosine-specific restriction endonuclease McrA
MHLLGFKAQTAGERLFQFILKEFYGAKSLSEIKSLTMLGIGERMEMFSDYFLGTGALNLLSRCIKKAERIKKLIENDLIHQSEMTKYIQQSLGIAQHGDSVVEQFASLSLQAAADSKRRITESVKDRISEGKAELSCYICGWHAPRRSDKPGIAIQFEHLWPSSLGGNSCFENLLPACNTCNQEKGAMILWHTAHVSSFVLKPNPSTNELTAISRREKIAQHMRTIIDHACVNKLDIRSAAIEIGAIDMNSIKVLDADDAVDFFNFQLGK